MIDATLIDRDKRYTDDPQERAKCQTCGKRRRTVRYRQMTNLKSINTPLWLCDPCVSKWAKSGVYDANER